MSEQPITAEDLTLYALQLLEGEEAARIEVLLRSSSEARTELALIRGDLAAFALAVPQQTPPALSRQRLLKQVARERRVVPIVMEVQEAAPYRAGALETPAAAEGTAMTQDLSRVDDLPRVDAGATQRSPGKRTLPLQQRVVSPAEPFSHPDAVAENTANLSPTGAAFDQAAEEDVWVPRGARVPQQAAGPRAGEAGADNAHAERTENVAGHALNVTGHALNVAGHALPGSRLDAAGQGSQRDAESSFQSNAFDEQPDRGGSRLAMFWAWTGWATAAALAAGCVFAVRQNYQLRDQMATQTATVTQANANLARAQVVLQALQSSAAQRFVLARQDTAPVPSARVAYLPEQGTLVFQGTNLEPLPAYKAYELWLIPAGEGRQPIPAGVFRPDERGYAAIVVPQLPKGTIAGNFGVTIEDEAGSPSPTLPILLIGQQT